MKATKTKPVKETTGRSITPAPSTNGNGSHGNETVRLPSMNIRQVKIPIIGVTPLMVLRFSEKAQNMMLGKQRGEAKAGREAKKPLELFKDSYYRDEDGFTFPSVCFKAAGVNVANDIQLKQTEMRRAFHVMGQFVRIEAPPLAKENWTKWDYEFEKDLEWEHEHGCSMRSDPVRNASGVADIRFRANFPVWSVTVPVEFNESVISLEKLMMLFTAAGFGNGVGEWRPASKESKTGTFGRWTLKTE